MSSRYLRLALNETIHCPSCGHPFALRDGISATVLQRLAKEEAVLEKQLRERITADERRKARTAADAAATAHAKALADAETTAKLQLARIEAERDAALRQINTAVANTLASAKAQAQAELDALRRMNAEQNRAREDQIRSLRDTELNLRKELAATEQARSEADLNARRRLDQERAKIRTAAMKEQEERDRQALADAERKLAEARATNNELNRKLQQGSQQAQGEIGEGTVQEYLEATFRHDEVLPIPNGARGADFIHRVRTPDCRDAGIIVWEVKNTSQYRTTWIEKLKADAREHRARLAILVTTTLPRNCERTIFLQDGVLVVAESSFRVIADIARDFVLRQHLHTQLAHASTDQMARLLEYAVRGALPDRLNTSLLNLHQLATQHQQEVNYLKKLHAKRTTLLQITTDSLQAIKGEIAAILRDPEAERRLALPELDGDDVIEAHASHSPTISPSPKALRD